MIEFPHHIESKQLDLLVEKFLRNTEDWQHDDGSFSKRLSADVTARVLYDEEEDGALGGTLWSGYRIDLYKNRKPYMTSGWKFQHPISDLYGALARQEEKQKKEKEEFENSKTNKELTDYIKTDHINTKTRLEDLSRTIAEIHADAQADVGLADALILSRGRKYYISICMTCANNAVIGHYRYGSGGEAAEGYIKNAEAVASYGGSEDTEELIRGYQKLIDSCLKRPDDLWITGRYVETYKSRIQQLKNKLRQKNE